MSLAVKLDSEFQSWAVEIQDIWIDRMLSPKLVTGEISIPQATPENAFAIGCTLAQITGATHWGETYF